MSVEAVVALPSTLVEIRLLDDSALADDAVMRAFYDLTQRSELLGRPHAPTWSFAELRKKFRSRRRSL